MELSHGTAHSMPGSTSAAGAVGVMSTLAEGAGTVAGLDAEASILLVNDDPGALFALRAVLAT